jgi:hypothetical protein
VEATPAIKQFCEEKVGRAIKNFEGVKEVRLVPARHSSTAAAPTLPRAQERRSCPGLVMAPWFCDSLAIPNSCFVPSLAALLPCRLT